MSQPNTWLPLLHSLKLARADQSLVQRFRKNPQSRIFLPIFELLKRHQLDDEALELLAEGVARDPRYSAARMTLVNELFHRGQLAEAWQILESTVTPLKENFLAQRLRLKLAIALAKEYEARETMDHMVRRNMADDSCRPLLEGLRTMEFKELRQFHINNLIAQGIAIAEDDPEMVAVAKKPIIDSGRFFRPRPDDHLPLSYQASFLDSLKDYRAIPLRDLAKISQADTTIGAPLQVDSLTLAEYYDRQGFFERALQIYQNLWQRAPESDFILDKMRTTKAKVEGSSQSQRFHEREHRLVESLAGQTAIDNSIEYLKSLRETLEAI